MEINTFRASCSPLSWTAARAILLECSSALWSPSALAPILVWRVWSLAPSYCYSFNSLTPKINNKNLQTKKNFTQNLLNRKENPQIEFPRCLNWKLNKIASILSPKTPMLCFSAEEEEEWKYNWKSSNYRLV